jgi:hypothetical protein
MAVAKLVWHVLRVILGTKQRWLVRDLGRRPRVKLADFNSRSLELHLSAFKGPHP